MAGTGGAGGVGGAAGGGGSAGVGEPVSGTEQTQEWAMPQWATEAVDTFKQGVSDTLADLANVDFLSAAQRAAHALFSGTSARQDLHFQLSEEALHLMREPAKVGAYSERIELNRYPKADPAQQKQLLDEFENEIEKISQSADGKSELSPADLTNLMGRMNEAQKRIEPVVRDIQQHQ